MSGEGPTSTVLAFPGERAVDALASLPVRHHRIVRALVECGGNTSAAARALGMHRSSLVKAASRPDIRRAVAAASVDAMRAGIVRTMALYDSSVDKLASLRNSRNPWVAMEASRAVASLALKALEIHELRDRLATLEEAVKAVREQQA